MVSSNLNPTPTTASRWRERRRPQMSGSKRKIVVFRLGQERYALPINRVQQILDDYTSYGELEGGQSLLQRQGDTITVVDPSQLFVTSRDSSERTYLIICRLQTGDLVGIPVPQLPKVFDVSEAQMMPLPDQYRRAGLPTVVETLIQLDEQRDVFFLDVDQLLQAF